MGIRARVTSAEVVAHNSSLALSLASKSKCEQVKQCVCVYVCKDGK